MKIVYPYVTILSSCKCSRHQILLFQKQQSFVCVRLSQGQYTCNKCDDISTFAKSNITEVVVLCMISFVCDQQMFHVVLLQRTIFIVFTLITMANISPLYWYKSRFFFFNKTDTNQATYFFIFFIFYQPCIQWFTLNDFVIYQMLMNPFEIKSC